MSNIHYLDFPEPFDASMREMNKFAFALRKYSKQERKIRIVSAYQHNIMPDWAAEFFFQLWNLGEE